MNNTMLLILGHILLWAGVLLSMLYYFKGVGDGAVSYMPALFTSMGVFFLVVQKVAYSSKEHD